MQASARKPIPIHTRRHRRYDTTGFKHYSFDVNYNNSPDVFTYYFKAVSAKDVSRATGVEIDYISECSADEIKAAIRHGKHIDIVISGRLIEQDDC